VPGSARQGKPWWNRRILARSAIAGFPHGSSGKPYAGCLAFKLPFGALFDQHQRRTKKTGIGNYNSDQNFFLDATIVACGDGARALPAMPFVPYTDLTRRRSLAIKA